MQKTANQIKSEFELLASGHYQIHSFLYAQEFEQQAYENLIYPLMLVYPLGGNLSGTSYTRNYRVVIADRVLKSEGNELEVESDTQLIALDTLAYWMKLGTNERFSITSSNTITPFWEKWGDEVTGHFVDIGIEEFYDFNSCAIPLSSAIPSPTNPCKDARILINSVVYGNAPSDTNFNVVVKDQLGALVGSLIGGEWIVNTGGACANASYTIEDSLGNVLYTGTIPSGGTLTQAISNSTLNVNNSASTLISSRSILAQGTSSYNVADSVAVIKDSAGTTLKSENILATASENITINDSVAVIKDSANNTLKSENILAEATENISISDSVAVIKNSAGTTLKSENILAQASENITINDSSVENSDATYSVDVLAEGSLTLPDSQINVNSVDSGDVVSVKTIDVNLEDSLGAPVVPTSVGLVGNTLTIEVPSGSTPMDVDFSADKLTASIGENITFTDLSDQTPTHWSWRFNDGTTSILQNPVKSFSTLGFKNVSLLAGKVGAGGVNIKNNYIEIIGDADATAFLLATGITDTTIVSAINVLVTDFKNAGIWAKMKAIYPMVGGTATTHKFNLKDPRDLNAAFRLSFSGGWTHSANGALPNGSNAYADTFFNPSIDNSANSSHLSYYSRTLVNESKIEMGCYSGINYNQIAISFGGTTYCNPNNAGGDIDVNFATNSQGFFLASRTSATAIMGQRNLTQVTGLSNENRNNFKIFIGTYNNNGIPDAAGYSSKQCAFSSIGDGLSSAEATNFYNIVQAFQTTLSRQV